MSKPIEYFYSAHSAYAWLGSARVMEVARAAGRRIEHRPMNLRRVVEAAGSVPFTERTPGHRAYFFGREMKRWAEQRGAALMEGMPTHHRHDITLPNCLIIAAIEAGHEAGRLAHALLSAHWTEDADLAEPATLRALAEREGYPGAALLERAASDSVRARYEENTNEAITRSVFGSPTYFVDGDMFYGQDRLEMVERALREPYR